ncbi:AcrR family transcriptional regulator [Rubricella aquisinus]|uniref:AcrR family transcriptional regulator n=1 Tax=Rubricella aquisinus TaxID=2028108 RepID=A0A840WP20_9RHOB|nr:TetR/AcrR family transcriptional regulator [Rubricella aquisinus]MBB5515392.1 AcrR family transcriptional regulator [Rubricella aquisinus]
MTKPPSKQARDSYHHGDLRAQLIEATRHLVELKGPDHLSVSEACRLAGVSTAAPYKHFKDKDELLRAVAFEGMGRQRDQMLAALEGLPERSLERISALGHVYINFARNEPAVFRLMFGLSDDHSEDDAMIDKGKKTFAVVREEVAAYRGSTVIESIDERRAFQLWSFVHGLSFLLIDGKLQKMEMPVDMSDMLDDIARRVMGEVVST